MGNIRPTYIKRVAAELLEKFPDEFNEDFEHNKTTVEALSDVDAKVLRNRIAGYITRRVKQGATEDELGPAEAEEEPEEPEELEAEPVEAEEPEEPETEETAEEAVEALKERSGVDEEAEGEPETEEGSEPAAGEDEAEPASEEATEEDEETTVPVASDTD